jgi:hypothetical protein
VNYLLSGLLHFVVAGVWFVFPLCAFYLCSFLGALSVLFFFGSDVLLKLCFGCYWLPRASFLHFRFLCLVPAPEKTRPCVRVQVVKKDLHIQVVFWGSWVPSSQPSFELVVERLAHPSGVLGELRTRF